MIVYRYCTQCRSELDLAGAYPQCSECGVTYYKNSKPCVGILPIRDNQVLLSKRGIEPYKGASDIIGGFLENGEHPLDGIEREIAEETDLDIEINELLGFYMDEYGKGGDSTLNIFYIGEVLSGKLESKDDISSLEWVDIDTIQLNSGFKNTREALRDLKEWVKNQ